MGRPADMGHGHGTWTWADPRDEHPVHLCPPWPWAHMPGVTQWMIGKHWMAARTTLVLWLSAMEDCSATLLVRKSLVSHQRSFSSQHGIFPNIKPFEVLSCASANLRIGCCCPLCHDPLVLPPQLTFHEDAQFGAQHVVVGRDLVLVGTCHLGEHLQEHCLGNVGRAAIVLVHHTGVFEQGQ